ncbi:hypothetical protein BGZ60DRAFT_430170 [Tricladium varicosporioides]|nr:hypothetical protein BGZ60DRAFT_430170 [Hymenoscyphus varicosporioides]
MSTIIQTIVLLDNCILDQPTTPAGRQWKTALSYLASCEGWFSLFWGRHLEAQEKVTLVIDWKTDSTAQKFLATQHASFALLFSPLIAQPLPNPSIADLYSLAIEPAALPRGGLTTIRKLTYNSLSDYERFYLLSKTVNEYFQSLGMAARAGDANAAGWKGGSTAWALDEATGSKTTTLWIFVSWESEEAEQRCEKYLQAENGENIKEVDLDPALEKADPGGELYHVAWDMLTENLMERWKESDNTRWPYNPFTNGLT